MKKILFVASVFIFNLTILSCSDDQKLDTVQKEIDILLAAQRRNSDILLAQYRKNYKKRYKEWRGNYQQKPITEKSFGFCPGSKAKPIE